MDNEGAKRIPLTAIGATTFHPKKHNVSFGRWAMPVMAKKMVDSDPSERKRAVQSLCDYVFDSRRVAAKEFLSVVPHLKTLHKDEDREVRLKVAQCFGAITATAAGRQTFEKQDFYFHALKLAEDENEDIRQAAFTAVHRVSLSPIGAESLVRAGGTEILIRRIPLESGRILVPLLQGLHSCCLVDPNEALKVGGLQAVIPLLSNPISKVRKIAATVIKDLTIEAKGRKIALDLDAVPALLELCSDKKDAVKAKALAALMMQFLEQFHVGLKEQLPYHPHAKFGENLIVNATCGKYRALKGEALEKILPMIKNESVEIRLNAIKVLTALGEAPEGREQLMNSYRMLLRLFHDDYDEVRKATDKLIEVITFKP